VFADHLAPNQHADSLADGTETPGVHLVDETQRALFHSTTFCSHTFQEDPGHVNIEIHSGIAVCPLCKQLFRIVRNESVVMMQEQADQLDSG
jgi:hypothetical protein